VDVITHLNEVQSVVNAGLTGIVETTPDTLTSLATGNRIKVREPGETVPRRAYRARTAPGAQPW